MTTEIHGRPMPSPALTWESGHVPYAERFADVYYSRDGGLDEARHIFLAGNGLPDAWQRQPTFCIGELGFGTGLNFLATWELWRRTRRPGTRLHYVAVEGYPLTRTELASCLAPWTALQPLTHRLCDVYPEPQSGFLRVFPTCEPGEIGEVVLTLLFGEAAHMLTMLDGQVDAWFLDGFSPEKNPDMWQPAIFEQMARLSAPNASLATYTVAGAVRRGLEAAGFDVGRAPGYGRKRDMLRGQRRPQQDSAAALPPWFARAAHGPAVGHAAVVGAGLAGAHAAAALRRRGWSVTIFDRHSQIAAEASGNPRAVMTPRLTAAPAHDGRFFASAWRFALQMFEDLADAGHSLPRAHVGSLQLVTKDSNARRFDEIATRAVLPASFLQRVDASEASDVAGVRLPSGGLFFPQGGWLAPRDLCTALQSGSEMRLGADVASLQHIGGRWRLFDTAHRPLGDYDAVVLGNALGLARLTQAAWLPLEARRGQVSFVPPSDITKALRTVLLYGGYLTPADHGFHALGATFDPVPTTKTGAVDLRAADHARNLADLARVLPDFLTSPPAAVERGFAGLRCTSPDHLPIVGPVPEPETFAHDFAQLRHGHPWARYPEARYHNGLYVMTALGARGLVAAPLAAEILAAHVTGEVWPVERDVVTALHPARFLVRALKRQDA